MLGKQILLTSTLTKRIFSHLAPRDREALREVMDPNGIIEAHQNTFDLSGMHSAELTITFFTKRNGKLLLHITDYKKSATKEISLPNNERVKQLFHTHEMDTLTTCLLSDAGKIYQITYQSEHGIRIHDKEYVTPVTRIPLVIKQEMLNKTVVIMGERLFITESGQLHMINPNCHLSEDEAHTIMLPTPDNQKVKDMYDTQGDFVLCLTASGNLYAYERIKFKELIDGKTTNSPTPKLIPSSSIGKVKQFVNKRDDSNSSYLAYISECGKLYELGIAPIVLSPKWVDNDHASQVFYDEGHTYIITRSGALYGFGPNRSGELGLGHRNPVTTATPIILPHNEKALHISVEYGSAFVVTHSGAVYVFGKNNLGALLLGHKNEVSVPNRLNVVNNNKQVPLLFQQLAEFREYVATDRQTCINLTELPHLRIIVNDQTSFAAQATTDPAKKRKITPVTFESLKYNDSTCQPPLISEAVILMFLGAAEPLQLDNIIVQSHDFRRLMRFITRHHYLHVTLTAEGNFKCSASTGVNSPECVFVSHNDSPTKPLNRHQILNVISDLPYILEKKIEIYGVDTICDMEITPGLLLLRRNIIAIKIHCSATIKANGPTRFLKKCLADNMQLISLDLGYALPDESQQILARNKKLREFNEKSNVLSTGLSNATMLLMELKSETITIKASDFSSIILLVKIYIDTTQFIIEFPDFVDLRRRRDHINLLNGIFSLCLDIAKKRGDSFSYNNLKELIDYLSELLKLNKVLKKQSNNRFSAIRIITDGHEHSGTAMAMAMAFDNGDSFYENYVAIPTDWILKGYELYFRCTLITRLNIYLALKLADTLITVNHKEALKIKNHAALSYINEVIADDRGHIDYQGDVLRYEDTTALKLWYQLLSEIDSHYYLNWMNNSYVKSNVINQNNALLFAPLTLKIIYALVLYQTMPIFEEDVALNFVSSELPTKQIYKIMYDALWDSTKLLPLMSYISTCYSFLPSRYHIYELRNFLIPKAKFAHETMLKAEKKREARANAARKAIEHEEWVDELATEEENEGAIEMRPIPAAFFQAAPRPVNPEPAVSRLAPPSDITRTSSLNLTT